MVSEINIYEFRIAYKSEDELQTLNDDPGALLKVTLPDGQPNYKSIFVKEQTEERAHQKAVSYVSKTKYKDIKDNLII